MRRRTLLVALLLLVSLSVSPLFGVDSEAEYRVSLVTTGPGEEVYLWWGHTALMVENLESGVMRFYDFGVFSFETENFFLNFLFGRLWYMAYSSPAEESLLRMIRRDRTLQVQELVFQPGKKRELIDELEYRVRPENREYLYDYYRDNCATRIRDLLDQAYDGELRRVAERDGAMTIRRQTRRFTGRNLLVEWPLMFLMSGGIDQAITGWEAMFLPSEIPRYLEEVRLKSGPDAGTKVIAADRLLHLSSREAEIPEHPGSGIPLPALTGSLLALLFIFGRRLSGPGQWAIHGVYRAILVLTALLGTLLFFFMLFTDHEVTHGNWNLLLLNPLHWLALFSPFRLQYRTNRFKEFALYLPWILTIDGSLILLTAGLFGFPQQELGETIAFLLPLGLGITGPWIYRLLKPLNERSIVN